MSEEQNERMEYYREKILTWLAEAYRKSKKDRGENVIRRRTALNPEKICPQYRQNDGEIEEITALNEAAESCAQMGFLNFKTKKFSHEIETIYLEDLQIEEVEAYLKAEYGYESKQDKREIVRKMIRQYEGKSPAASQICRELEEELEQNRIPKQYEQTEEILKALVFIENNQTPLFLREVSMMIYGTSKYFEEKMLDTVCRKLRKYLERPCPADEMPGEILEDYFIYPEQQRLCMKGNVALKKCGELIELGAFPGGVEFAAEELADIEGIFVRGTLFVTVENKTAYYRCKKKDAVFFYLGGYVSRMQREFLKKVIEENPQLAFLHFGDIDSGGFYIHEHLCRMTGKAFGLWHMSVEELRNPKYEKCLQKLTIQDKRRLRKIAGKEPYKESAEYMLEKDVKLEQEIVSYYLAEEYRDFTISAKEVNE